MQKLKLELDSLHVESFETSKVEAASRGTVRGHGGTNDLAYNDDRVSLWTFGYDCEKNVIVMTEDCMYSDICSLGCAETSDCPVTP